MNTPLSTPNAPHTFPSPSPSSISTSSPLSTDPANQSEWYKALTANPPTDPYDFPSSSLFPTRSLDEAQFALSLVQSKTINALLMKSNTKEDAMNDFGHFFERIDLDISKMNFVHIAGSKGKGSVSSYTESILHQHGYKTGLYTSPHLIDVRERFRIDTSTINEALFCHYFWLVWDKLLATLPPRDSSQTAHRFSLLPSFFSLLTLVAFCLYKHENVDVVVCEVGLGGKLDSTNIIPQPLCTAITTLSLEHSEILGNTLPQIAHEKCGIFKRNVPIVTFPQQRDAWETLMKESGEMGLKPILIDTDARYEGVELGIDGDFQRQNVNMAMILTALAMKKMAEKGVVPKYTQIGPDLKGFKNGQHRISKLSDPGHSSDLDESSWTLKLAQMESIDGIASDIAQYKGTTQNSEDESTPNSSLDSLHGDPNQGNIVLTPYGSKNQLKKIKKTLRNLKHLAAVKAKQGPSGSPNPQLSDQTNSSSFEITPTQQWYSNSTAILEQFTGYLNTDPAINQQQQDASQSKLFAQLSTPHSHIPLSSQSLPQLPHSRIKIHPVLNYPTFHLVTLTPQAIVGICKTQLRGRCDIVDTTHPPIKWLIDGAHTNESIISSTHWFQENTMNKAKNGSNGNSNTSPLAANPDQPSPLSPTNGIDVPDLDPNRILVFNCGHVRPSFSLLEPLLTTLSPFHHSFTTPKIGDSSSSTSSTTLLPFNNPTHIPGTTSPRDGVISSVLKTNLTTRRSQDIVAPPSDQTDDDLTQKWSVYLDSKFNHVFFCPFDQDKPHPIPLPTLGEQFSKRFPLLGNVTTTASPQLRTAVAVGKDIAGVVLNHVQAQSVISPSQQHHQPKHQDPKLNPTHPHTQTQTSTLTDSPIVFQYGDQQLSFQQFQELLEQQLYTIHSQSDQADPSPQPTSHSAMSPIEQPDTSIQHTTPSTQHSTPSTQHNVTPMRWQLSNMVVWDFLTTAGLLQHYPGTAEYNTKSIHTLGHGDGNEIDSVVPVKMPQVTAPSPSSLLPVPLTNASLSILTSINRSSTGLYSQPLYATQSYDYITRSPQTQIRPTVPSTKSPLYSFQQTFNHASPHEPLTFHPPIATLTRNLLLPNNNNSNNNNNNNTNLSSQHHPFRNLTGVPKTMQYHVMPTTNDVIMAIKHIAAQNHDPTETGIRHHHHHHHNNNNNNSHPSKKASTLADNHLYGFAPSRSHAQSDSQNHQHGNRSPLDHRPPSPRLSQHNISNQSPSLSGKNPNTTNQSFPPSGKNSSQPSPSPPPPPRNNKNNSKSPKPARRGQKTNVFVTGSLYLAGNVLKDLKVKV